MRGRVTDWKDDRGFGFIEPEEGGERVFFHISGVARGAPRPSTGSTVSFDLGRSADGKLRAINVGPAGFAAVSSKVISKRVVLSLAALLALSAIWWSVVLGKVPIQIFWVFAGMSSVAFVMYGLDKWAAKRDAQRTPENTLQLCALLGGWPGALLAQQVFRHKSSKPSFQVVFWFMVVINCGALGFYFSEPGSAFINQLLQMR
jgi:uncharacterized membrane protein YsdA (DUF1294 family)/cold shock CspA family protein